MKKLTRDRVVPTISAKVSWLSLGTDISETPSVPNCAINRRTRANRFFTGIEQLIHQIILIADIPLQQILDKHGRQFWFAAHCKHHRLLFYMQQNGVR